MKRALAGLSILALSLSAVSPVLSEEPTVGASTLSVQGMGPGAGATVKKALETLPGVLQVVVSEEAGVAVVVYDPARIQSDEFTRAVEASGYLATFAKADYRCPTCPATYAEAGRCLVDGTELEAVS